MIEVTEQETGADDFFSTPEINVPATPPDAHQATVVSVTSKHLNNDKQTAVISINLVSRNVPTVEESLDIFVPKVFEEEGITLGSKFDPATLPEEEGNKQRGNFQRSIANSEKTASLQRYVFNADSIARKAGRDPVELGLNRKPTNLDEYTENLNKMLQGVEVIWLRREKGGDDPAFSHRLQVKDIVPGDEAENNPKRFKKYVLAWENQ